MKFDYKPKQAELRSPILKRGMHVFIGFFAFLCLVFILTFNKSSNTITATATTTNVTTLPLALPKAQTPLEAPVSNVSSSIPVSIKEVSTPSATDFSAVKSIVASSQSESTAEVKLKAEASNKPEVNNKAEIKTEIKKTETATPITEAIAINMPISTKKNELSTAPQDNLPLAMQEDSNLAPQKEIDLPAKPEKKSVAILKPFKIRKGDTLPKIFAKLGIPSEDAHEIMKSEAARGLRSLRSGQQLKIQVGVEKQLEALTLDLAPGSTLYVSRQDDKFKVEHKIIPFEKQIAFGKGAIQKSLFTSGKRAGLDQNILAQMVEIFGWDIDFGLDLKPNDTFRVLYEEKRLEGERVQTGAILAAEIVNKGNKYQAVRYKDKSGKVGYYTPEGSGFQQAFLRNPVNFTRISSHFGDRNHPVLNRMKKHMGVDYSAPKGTPVAATADGTVIFAGKRSGYGNVIELQHGKRYSTLYAHLSKISKEVRIGQEVTQGQVIGNVGRTGLATGDHLHFEFRVDGIHQNPLTVALPKKNLIPTKNKNHFTAHAKEMLRLLDFHEKKVHVARVAYPVNE